MTPVLAVCLEVVLIVVVSGYTYLTVQKSGTNFVSTKTWGQHFGLCLSVGFGLWLLNWVVGWGLLRSWDAYLNVLAVLISISILLGLVSGLALFCAFGINVDSAASPLKFKGMRIMGKRAKTNLVEALPSPDLDLKLCWCEECKQWTPAALVHQHSA